MENDLVTDKVMAGATIKEGTLSSNTPSAPFVTDTKSWVALALKRMMRYAADNGFQKIAFVNGDQSAERYDLSKQVDSIYYQPEGNGTFNVSVSKDDREVWANPEATARELEDVVGKELAQKMVDGEGESVKGMGFMKKLSGIDLKVGGEGMKAFYDRIVPQVASDLLKKMGGGKLETVRVSSDMSEQWGIYDATDEENQGLLETHSALWKAQEAAKENYDNSGIEVRQIPKYGEQLGFTVPAAASEPMALFSPARDRTNIDTATRRINKFIDAFEARQLKDADTQILGPTPVVLQALGARDLPLQIDGATVRKVLAGKHANDVTADMLRQLPEGLYNPLLVFDSTTSEAKVLVTEMASAKGNPVVAVVHFTKRHGGMVINDVASVYEKSQAATAMTRWINDGLLRYVRNEESLSAGSATRPTLPASIADLVKGQLGSVVQEENLVQTYGPRYSPMRSLIHKVDAAVDGLHNLPDQFDYLKDRYLALGKIARVDEMAKEVRDAFNKAGAGDKHAVYSYLTTRGAQLSMIGPVELQQMAKRLKDTINYVGDALVARGLLDPVSRAQYKDQYLPRLYLRHLLSAGTMRAVRTSLLAAFLSFFPCPFSSLPAPAWPLVMCPSSIRPISSSMPASGWL